MRIVCVSRGTFGGGKELAEKLAAKLGIACVGREQVTDLATRAGIPVGKLEMAVMRPRPITEQLALQRECFKAFMTATLAEQAMKGGVVYHGRTGHLVLPSVGHVLRVRAIMDPESRVGLTMRRLGLDRDKAHRYNEQVDEDRRRWARSLYNVDWDDPAHYDLVVSLDRMSADNAAAAVLGVAQLPDFAPTPASLQVLSNLHLAARCRLALGSDERTRQVDAQVRAEAGSVSVTYPPRFAGVASLLPDVVSSVSGVTEVRCTMASTNIVWIQERFDPTCVAMTHLLDIASKWNAAVALVRLAGEQEEVPAVEPEDGAEPARPGDAGILEDRAPTPATGDDAGMKATMSRLLQEGRAGGQWTVRGGRRELVQSLDRTVTCSLVVVGDVFVAKEASVRKRERRQLAAYLSEALRVPAVGADELEHQFLFGPSHWLKMLAMAAIAAVMFWVPFHFQAEVLELLTRPGAVHRAMVTAALLVIVPVFAWVYGGFSQYLLRLARFE